MAKSYNSGTDRIYCYPGTNILINKENIRDLENLHIQERRITFLAGLEMQLNPVKGNFDQKHLQAIHKAFFRDIYEWAGKLRKVDIAKGNMFCRVMCLEQMGVDIFQRIKSDNFLIGLDQDTVFYKMAEYMGDINAWHPFREGNGRTQREFIYLLGQATGYKLDYSMADSEEMMEASIKSFNCDYSGFETIFRRIAEPMTLEEQRIFLGKVSKEGLRILEEMAKENKLPDRTKAKLDTKIKEASYRTGSVTESNNDKENQKSTNSRDS